MNWDRIAGNWKQTTGKVKEQWGKPTDDDLTVINGQQDQLVGRIQERYGIAKDEAERQVKGVGGPHVELRRVGVSNAQGHPPLTPGSRAHDITSASSSLAEIRLDFLTGHKPFFNMKRQG